MQHYKTANRQYNLKVRLLRGKIMLTPFLGIYGVISPPLPTEGGGPSRILFRLKYNPMDE
jgi:hypothetical protein